MQDLGSKLRLVVMAHRRITILRKHEEHKDASSTNPPKSLDHSIDVQHPADGLFEVETKNLVHDPFETTDEVKALTQEIIKTIRDIIVSSNEPLLGFK
jgi:Lon-like ATP-dependent protease